PPSVPLVGRRVSATPPPRSALFLVLWIPLVFGPLLLFLPPRCLLLPQEPGRPAGRPPAGGGGHALPSASPQPSRRSPCCHMYWRISGRRPAIISPASSSSPTTPRPTWQRCDRARKARGCGPIHTRANHTPASSCSVS